MLIVGALRYLPIPFLPPSVHEFFFEYGFYIQIGSGLLLLLFLLIDALKKGLQWYFLIIILPVLLLLFPLFFIDLNNRLVVRINKGRSPQEFRNVILGSTLEVEEDEATFHFEIGAFSRSELQFGKNIGKPYFDIMANELDFSFVKYYGDDWLWYIPD